MEAKIRKQMAGTIVYYAFALPSIVYFMTSAEFRSGPYVPNLDFFSPLFVIGISLYLLLHNFYLFFAERRSYALPTAMHLIGLVVGIYLIRLHNIY
jgi:hypothetical protein